MLSSVKTAVLAAAAAQTVAAYSSYMELIPNGENIGKPLGHTDTGYTDFGTLFSDDGTEWSKVCSQTWPGGSVTCGEALGDPCCTWTSGDPDYTLTEPNTDGTTCASGSTTASSTASSATTTTSTAESGTTDSATQDTTAVSNSTDSPSTTETEDGSYCE